MIDLAREVVDRGGLAELESILSSSGPDREAFAKYWEGFVTSRAVVHALTETGVLDSRSILGGLWHRIGRRWVPLAHTGESLEELLRHVFTSGHARSLLAHAQRADLARVIGAAYDENALAKRLVTAASLRASLRVLSYRIAAVGLESELERQWPRTRANLPSPFAELVSRIDKAVDDGSPEDLQAARATLHACAREVRLRHASATTEGTSLRLGVITTRMLQQIRRAKLLLRCFSGERPHLALADLILAVTRGAVIDLALWPFVSQSTRQLAVFLSRHNAVRGNGYVADSRRAWYRLLAAAILGGCVIAPFAFVKIALAKLPLAPLWQGLAFGLNYAACFAIIALLGGVVATKQPAFTAATMALAMRRDRHGLAGLADFAARLCRSQLASFAGNLVIAFPLAALIVVLLELVGLGPMDPEKAAHIIEGLHPVSWRLWLYAATAGLCLSLSGLAAAYVDNSLLVGRFVRRLRWVRIGGARLAPERRERLAKLATAKGGVITGSVVLGLLLGAAPALGSFTGLPIDIRHVAFSAAQLGGAVAVVGGDIAIATHLSAIAGVLTIGLVNFVMSFGLTLAITMYALGVRSMKVGALAGSLWRRFWLRPADFFLPVGDSDEMAGRDPSTSISAPDSSVPGRGGSRVLTP